MNRDIYERIKIYCEKNQLIQENDGVVVGVSGGADSVFLYSVLKRMQKEMQLRFCVVHINHGIRGSEAEEDEAYVCRLAKEGGDIYRVFHTDIPSMAKQQGISEEEAGRLYRYQCFEQCRKEMHFQKIAVAHHQDDQAETVLFQLFRGSGLRGLSGMRPLREYLIRPLLCVRRREIEQALREQGTEYRQDSTNEQEIYTRNRLRIRVLPYIEQEIQPAAVPHVCQAAELVQEAAMYILQQAKAFYAENVTEHGGCEVSCRVFNAQATVIQKETILLMLEHLAGKRKDITMEHVEAVLRLAQGGTGKRVHLPYKLKAGKDYDVLWMRAYFSTNEEEDGSGQEIPLQFSKVIVLSGDKGEDFQVVCEREKRENLSREVPKNHCTKWFDYVKIKSMLKFRHPMEGDFFWLTSAGDKKKLSRFLMEQKIPLEQRRSLWVLADGQHILWIPKYGRTSAYYYVSGQTEEVLCIHIDEIVG